MDVGANVGYMSVLGSQLVGERGSVIAVEPEERNLRLLRANLWRNECANAVVLPVAAGSAYRFLPLAFNESNRGDHQAGGPGAVDRLVPSAPLDAFLADRSVDVIKVDTQGYDHEVIAGLNRTIAAQRPTILCEFWVEGMRARSIDPLQVAQAYGRDFVLRLLGDDGELTEVDPDGLVSAAESLPRLYVNAVLTPRETTA